MTFVRSVSSGGDIPRLWSVNPFMGKLRLTYCFESGAPGPAYLFEVSEALKIASMIRSAVAELESLEDDSKPNPDEAPGVL